VNLKSIRQRDPIGDKEAFMDIGLDNLSAVVTTEGSAMLIKGGKIKSEYYWWKRDSYIPVYKRSAEDRWAPNMEKIYGKNIMRSTLKQYIKGMKD
jgi:hypothetical protein